MTIALQAGAGRMGSLDEVGAVQARRQATFLAPG
jgi:hypothetical protein